LQLELSKLNGQLQKFRREYREALSTSDLVKVRVVSAEIDQVTAEKELTQQQLQKIVLTAPFDSVVIEGDLSQMLGSPVERGDMLFKIAPLEGYRIILKVDERLISYVKVGQKGMLTLSSMPDRKFMLTVQKITAVAKADNNENIFRVEANLDNVPDLLRPGMEGIGKINTGRQNLLWIWTHELIDWLRLWFWSWSL
jgi:multidrug resistance efflux pump